LTPAAKNRVLLLATAIICAMALAGAVYAAYVLVPGILEDRESRSWLRILGVATVAGFALLLALSWLRRKIGGASRSNPS